MPLKRNWLAWIGLLVGVTAVLSYATLVVPRLSPYAPRLLSELAVPNLALIAIGLVCSAIAVRRAWRRPPTHGGRIIAPILGTMNVLVAVLATWYLFGFSGTLPESARAPAVGAAAPDFALNDQRGTPVTLADLRGRNALLVFYRGHW
jgi:hypothetical protein